MRQGKAVALAIAATVAATATLVPIARHGRGARPIPDVAAGKPAFSVEQSAALFVGVRKFTHEEIAEVPYAVDDAVDLAYMFALDPRVSLVAPKRVALALSGTPQKEESRQRLLELTNAGATVKSAGATDILTLLHDQAAAAGKDGVLIVSIATHGFVHDGIPWILGDSSVFRYPETTIPATRIFDIASESAALRSVIFVDACRERIAADRRSATQPETAAPLIRRMKSTAGQVVFYAAAAGGVAYDDPDARNGVFTKAVLEGLACQAATSNHIVTVGTLRSYVERNVRDWIRRNRNPNVRAATQIVLDGDTERMPLACCGAGCNRPVQLAKVVADGANVIAYDVTGRELWRRETGGRVVRAEAADLDADGKDEVLAGIDAGRILIFDDEGHRRGEISPQNLPLRTFITGDLFRRHTREIIAVWGDDPSRVTVYSPEAELLAMYEHPGPIDHITIDRPTRRHTPKLVLAGLTGITLFNPTKLASGKPLWSGKLRDRIADVEATDADHDGVIDIVVTTKGRRRVVLDVDGKVIGGDAAFTLR